MNSVTLIGRLTKDPELNYTTDGTAICKFTLAINRPTKDGSKAADFIRVTTFGNRAETCKKYLSKGLLLAVEGRIQTGSYKKDGQTVYTTDVIATNVEFIQWNKDKIENSEIPDIPQGFEEIEEDIPF